jgi:hypothetical protein
MPMATSPWLEIVMGPNLLTIILHIKNICDAVRIGAKSKMLII